jgi:hypothetical protein
VTGDGTGQGGHEVTGTGSDEGGDEVTGTGSDEGGGEVTGQGGHEVTGTGSDEGAHGQASHWQAIPPRRTWAATGAPVTEMPGQMPPATGPMGDGTVTACWGGTVTGCRNGTAGPPSVIACAGAALATASSAPVSSARASLAGSAWGMATENRRRCPQGIGAFTPLASRHT